MGTTRGCVACGAAGGSGRGGGELLVVPDLGHAHHVLEVLEGPRPRGDVAILVHVPALAAGAPDGRAHLLVDRLVELARRLRRRRYGLDAADHQVLDHTDRVAALAL